jgi:hypothetical protein
MNINSIGHSAFTRHLPLALLISIATAIAALAVSEFSVQFGRYVPSADIRSDYLWGCITAFGLALSLFFWNITSRERGAVLVLWALKSAVALIAMLPYENQYSFLDAYSYFQESADQRTQFAGMSWGDGTGNMIQFGVLIWHLLPPSYHALKIVCAYCGMIGVVLFWKACCEYLDAKDYRLFWILGLFPSLLFWSTILGKDPIILMGLGAAFYGFTRLARSRVAAGIGWLLGGLIVIALVRTWVVMIFFASLVAGLVLASRSRFLQIGFLGSVAIIFAFAWQQILSTFVVGQLDDILLLVGQYSAGWNVGGSAVSAIPEFNTWRDILAFLPKGAFAALFRPLPGEVGGPFALLAGIENMVLLAWTLFALLRARAWFRADATLLAALIFIAGWTLTYAPISIQNLGTAARFKMQVLPFVLFLGYLAMPSVKGHFAKAKEMRDAV